MSGSGSKALEELREATKKAERDLDKLSTSLTNGRNLVHTTSQQFTQFVQQRSNQTNSKFAAFQAKYEKLQEEKRQEEAAAKQSQSSSSSAPSKTSGPK